MRHPSGIVLAVLTCLAFFAEGRAGIMATLAASQQFRQEMTRGLRDPEWFAGQPVQLVDIASSGAIRCYLTGMWHELNGGHWVAKTNTSATATSVFHYLRGNESVSVHMAAAEVVQLVHTPQADYVVATSRILRVSDDAIENITGPESDFLHQVCVNGEGVIYAAAEKGLKRLGADRAWESVAVRDSFGRDWGTQPILGAAFDAANRLWVATKAGVAQLQDSRWAFFEPKDGLPWNEFTCIAPGPEGEMWFGTRLGVVRFDGIDWTYRQGPRWLPHDHVRQIVVDAKGTAWMATAGGLSALDRKLMTLEQKATHYEDEIEKYIKRTPYGFVAEAALARTADRASAAPQDSDNDGLWTAMYGAGECFGYAATGDAHLQGRAKKAFEALRFLQNVTQGGPHSPPKGYVARTVRPVAWPDPNTGRLQRDKDAKKGDKLWKAYEPRWPKSADGQWYWKSDTSSDELDGHYFFYPLYYEFCAKDDETEKGRVREVVRDLTDHLISHDFTLVDHDGKPTRWGVYGPQDLNRNPDWWQERGLKSLSILSYLAVAHYITEDEKYALASRELIDKHGYALNAMHPKVQHGPGSGNQSDDEMAVMCFYTLLRYSRDEALKHAMRVSFYRYWVNEAPEMNPFFNFAYAALCSNAQGQTPFGTFPLAPWDGWFQDSMGTLYGLSWDRVNWPSRNSHRLDIQPLLKTSSSDITEPYSLPKRGSRLNGKVLPVENRHFNHWNTDPWRLDYGGVADELAAGTAFLLPYYMGMYHGFIEKPQ